MINQTQKYVQLVSALRSDHFQGGYTHAAAFFFKTIQHLNADILLNELEIEEQQRQIRALEQKLGVVREQQRWASEGEQQRREESSEEEVAKDFSCAYRECGKRFQRQSGVKLHTLLVHCPAKQRQPLLFKFQVRAQQNPS